jgi:hypothetical protein
VINIHPLIRRISGRDDAYNIIEGLKHGGSAQKMRRAMTPFGSGWDPLRNLIADNLGKAEGTFNKFVNSSEFGNSLASGKVIKTLGQGAQGEAHLMQTTIKIGEKEHPFQYVRKTPLLNTKQGVLDEAARTHEMSDLNAPNIYGVDKENRTFMEHFAGESASAFMLKGGTLPEKFVDDLEGFFKASHSRGIAHIDAIRDSADWHSGLQNKGIYSGEYVPHNIIMTPEGRAGVIDFGSAVSPDKKPGMFGAGDRLKRSMEGYIGKLLPTAGDLDTELIKGLRRQKGKLSPSLVVPEVEKTISNTQITAASPGKVNNSTSDKIRKSAMATAQRSANMNLFENARSGGRRSKSTFAGSKGA